MKSLEERTEEEVGEVVRQYSMPDSLARLKFYEIKAYCQEQRPNRSEEFYVNMALQRLRNFGRAYRDQGGWEG